MKTLLAHGTCFFFLRIEKKGGFRVLMEEGLISKEKRKKKMRRLGIAGKLV